MQQGRRAAILCVSALALGSAAQLWQVTAEPGGAQPVAETLRLATPSGAGANPGPRRATDDQVEPGAAEVASPQASAAAGASAVAVLPWALRGFLDSADPGYLSSLSAADLAACVESGKAVLQRLSEPRFTQDAVQAFALWLRDINSPGSTALLLGLSAARVGEPGWAAIVDQSREVLAGRAAHEGVEEVVRAVRLASVAVALVPDVTDILRRSPDDWPRLTAMLLGPDSAGAVQAMVAIAPAQAIVDAIREADSERRRLLLAAVAEDFRTDATEVALALADDISATDVKALASRMGRAQLSGARLQHLEQLASSRLLTPTQQDAVMTMLQHAEDQGAAQAILERWGRPAR